MPVGMYGELWAGGAGDAGGDAFGRVDVCGVGWSVQRNGKLPVHDERSGDGDGYVQSAGTELSADGYGRGNVVLIGRSNRDRNGDERSGGN